MRIVQLVDSLAVGGAERMAVNLSVGLAGKGHSVQVVCLRESGLLATPLEEAGVPVVALRKPEGWDWRTLNALKRILQESQADVLHSHNPLVHHYAVVAGRLSGTIVVNTIHGIDNLEELGPAELLYAACCWSTQAIVSVCRKAEAHFRSFGVLPGNRISMIYNGIPLDSFLSINRGERPATGLFRFGAVGRLAKVKDHVSLLKAFGRVVEVHPEARLDILGDGPLRTELEDLIRSLKLEGKAKLPGERLAVDGFLGELDCFVQSSVSEALPMTMLEAMASAVPVVVTSVGGMPELVDACQCGWVTPPSQPDRLAEVMLRVIDATDRRDRAASGRAFVRENCSVKMMTDQYSHLYGRLLESRR